MLTFFLAQREPMPLFDFLAEVKITFRDGLSDPKRRKSTVQASTLAAFTSTSAEKPTMVDYVRAQTVTLPLLECYQFVSVQSLPLWTNR